MHFLLHRWCALVAAIPFVILSAAIERKCCMVSWIFEVAATVLLNFS